LLNRYFRDNSRWSHCR